MIIHDDKKAHKCDVCLKNFHAKSALARHYKTHTGEKHLVCVTCGQRFSRKDQLKRHQILHSEVRNFVCDLCPEKKAFKTKVGLKMHMLYHDEPKLQCSFCNHKSYTTYYLKKHEKTHFKT